jgi:hypothetical protein
MSIERPMVALDSADRPDGYSYGSRDHAPQGLIDTPSLTISRPSRAKDKASRRAPTFVRSAELLVRSRANECAARC